MLALEERLPETGEQTFQHTFPLEYFPHLHQPAFTGGQVGLQIACLLTVRLGQAKVRLTWVCRPGFGEVYRFHGFLAVAVGFRYIPCD